MTQADGRDFRQAAEHLARDLVVLAGETASLARLEALAAGATLRTSVAGMVAGLLLAIGGFIILPAALVLMLVALGLPPWVAALLVSVSLMTAGAFLTWVFYEQLTPERLTLPRTRRSVRETLVWLKEGAL